jgi:hypothetical protein
MLTAEDALGSVIKPRLHAAGADMTLIQTLTIQRDGYEDSLWIPDDVPTLLTQAKKSGAKLVVVDPINAFLPEEINSWNDQSVRRALRLKGANIRVTSLRGEAWEDRRHGSLVPLSRRAGSARRARS